MIPVQRATLNYWGQITQQDFHKSNVDFQPLTKQSNSEADVNALNQIVHSHVILVKDKENKELCNVVEVLSATVESDRLQYQNTFISFLVDTTNKLLETKQVACGVQEIY